MIRKIISVLLFVCLAIIPVIAYHFYLTPKEAFVDIPKVFNGFAMKNEMQAKYKKTETQRMKIVDSLSMDLQMMSNKLRSDSKNKELQNSFDAKRQYFFNLKNRMQEDNAALSDKYDKQILEQMSTYIMEYGKKNNFDFIYGSSGNGTLMYANNKYDISEQVIQYINDKYKGLE